MKVLLVGSGGREHAMAMAIAQSVEEPTLYAAMKYKNPGIAQLCKDYRLVNETDLEKVADYARRADLVVIGPEAPLQRGSWTCSTNAVYALLDLRETQL